MTLISRSIKRFVGEQTLESCSQNRRRRRLLSTTPFSILVRARRRLLVHEFFTLAPLSLSRASLQPSRDILFLEIRSSSKAGDVSRTPIVDRSGERNF